MISTKTLIEFDPIKTIDNLTQWISDNILTVLKRRGAVVGISGGVDSSVVAALCARALGRKRVVGLALPERDSSPISLTIAEKLVDQLKIQLVVEDITEGLTGMGCYERRDEAVKRMFPEFQHDFKFKLTLQSNPLGDNRLNVFNVTIIDDIKQKRRSTAYLRTQPLKVNFTE